MRPLPSASVPPWRLGGLALLPLALCLVLAAAAPAAVVEFSTPTVLRPDDLGEDVTFGGALALHRNTLAVRANSALNSWIYIYERDRGAPHQWRLAQVLDSNQLFGGDAFTGPLALRGDDMVVTDLDQGRLYHFFRGFGRWLVDNFRPRMVDVGYGSSVALGRRWVAVGAPGAGKVLLYDQQRFGPGNWGLVATLQGRVTSALAACLDPDQPVPGFGASVALSGETLVVGASDFDNPALFGRVRRNNGTYVFKRDRSSANGWRQVTAIAPPEGCDDFEAPVVSLDGPDLLVELGIMPSTWALFRRDLGGVDRWGRRTRREAPDDLNVTQMALRSNLVAIGDRHRTAAWIYARDHPQRNRWGLLSKLSNEMVPSLPCCPGGKTTWVTIGPREVVTAHPLEDTVLVHPSDPIQGDDFESGDTSAWTGRRGRVTVVGPGLDGSDAALEVAVGGGDPRASFVASNRPRREPSVSLDFSLLPNDVDLAGKPVEILRLYAGKPVLRLRLAERPFSSAYGLRLEVRTRRGGWFAVGAVGVPSNEERRVEIEYQAPTASGAKDGRVRLSVNGQQVRQKLKIDLERMLVNRVVLGLPVGSPAAGGGSFLVDNFALHR